MTNDDIIKSFCEELLVLYEKYNVSLGVEIDGDTHGIDSRFIVFTDGSFLDHRVLSYYSSHLDKGDLKDFLRGADDE